MEQPFPHGQGSSAGSDKRKHKSHHPLSMHLGPQPVHRISLDRFNNVIIKARSVRSSIHPVERQLSEGMGTVPLKKQNGDSHRKKTVTIEPERGSLVPARIFVPDKMHE